MASGKIKDIGGQGDIVNEDRENGLNNSNKSEIKS